MLKQQGKEIKAARAYTLYSAQSKHMQISTFWTLFSFDYSFLSFAQEQQRFRTLELHATLFNAWFS